MIMIAGNNYDQNYDYINIECNQLQLWMHSEVIMIMIMVSRFDVVFPLAEISILQCLHVAL